MKKFVTVVAMSVLVVAFVLVACGGDLAVAATSEPEQEFLDAVALQHVVPVPRSTLLKIGHQFCGDIDDNGFVTAVRHAVKSTLSVTKHDSKAAKKQFTNMISVVTYEAVEHLCPEWIRTRNDWAANS